MASAALRHSRRALALAGGALIAASGVASTAAATNVTGNPLADGFVYQGNSLGNGSYVRSNGGGNYGFDMYRSVITISSGSNLVIGSGAGAWNVGDTVLAVGGVFHAVSAQDNGWNDSYTGGAVNALYYGSPNLKLQAKFGTDTSIWSASTIAPSAGNGNGSLAQGGVGSVQVRTSGSNPFAFWAANAGTLNTLASSGHISRDGGTAGMTTDVARLIWLCDGDGRVSSWQILLNATLLQAQTNSGFGGLIPNANFGAIMTIQHGDNEYTDGLVQGVPAPGALAVLGLGGLLGGPAAGPDDASA